MRADRFICVADGPALLGISCVYGKVAYSATDLCRRIEVFKYQGADKSLARPGRKKASASEDFDFHISYL